MSGHKVRSFLNAYYGYNQIPMDPDDVEKTAFITKHGTYCYTVMLFGLKNKGVTFQHMIKRVFEKQAGEVVEIYVDDLVVKIKFAQQHPQHLAEVFSILCDYRIKPNPSKCTFGVTSG